MNSVDRAYLPWGIALLCLAVVVPITAICWFATGRLPDVHALGDPERFQERMRLVFAAYAFGGVCGVVGIVLTLLGLIQFNHRLRREG